SASLARDQTIATGYRTKLVCSLRPVAGSTNSSELTKAPPTGRWLQVVFLKFIRVRKPLQNRIVHRWPEIFEHAPKDRIQERICMRNVQVKRHQFAIQMKLRLIIERI